MTPELARTKLAALLQHPPQSPFLPTTERAAAAQALLAVLAPATSDAASQDAAQRAATRLSGTDPTALLSGAPSVDVAAGLTLTHPLSRHTPYQTGPLPVARDEVSRAVHDAARTLADRCGPDPVTRYLAAWRWLPALIRAHEPTEHRLGTLWDVLPADPRLPDRTVWDDASVTAALAGAGDRPAFLVFALGPVQGFIAQARSTRDLWIGSYLVSYLSWAALRAIADEIGPDAVLYPSLKGQPMVDAWLEARGVPRPPTAPPVPATARLVAAFPNKLLALVPEHRAGALGALAATAVREAWDELGRQANVWLGHAIGPDWRPEGWDAQLARHVETAWAALPWPTAGQEASWWASVRALRGGRESSDAGRSPAVLRRVGQAPDSPSSSYGLAHGLVQRAFDARKLTRQFGPASEPGYKCVLCGERAPVLGGTASYGDQRAAWQRVAERLRRPELLDVSGDERLCAVCLTRRVAPKTRAITAALGTTAPAFPSTSTLATLPFRRALLEHLRGPGDPAVLATLARFIDALDVLGRDRASLGAIIWLRTAARPGDGWSLDDVPDDRRELVERVRRFDGEWLLVETYERRQAELRRRGADHALLDALDTARGALRSLLGAASRAGLPRPGAYYAILVLDGDRMGRWVSGEQHVVTLGEVLHPDARAALAGDADWQAALAERRPFGPATHAALGAMLRDFSLWVVPWVVEQQHGGRLVYAGGDDVLALLPADGALAAADDLRATYASAVLARDRQGRPRALPQEPGPDLTIFRGMGPDATVSAGLLFAHHLLPLGLALEHVRDLEKRHAKGGAGRDAVAVGVARRSGPDDELRFVSKHRRGARTVRELVVAARELVSGRSGAQDADRGAASNRLPYLLRDSAAILDALDNPAARRRAVAALTVRHVPGEGGRRRLLDLYDALAAEPAAPPGRPAAPSPEARPVEDLARLLRLARFLEAET